MRKLVQAWVDFTNVAPLVPLALACLAGAMWYEVGWWWVVMLLAFALSRPDWRWWLAIVLLTAGVAWRSETIEAPLREKLGTPGSEIVQGELTMGRQAGPFAGERFGTLKAEGLTRKVLVVRAEDYEVGEVLEVTGKIFVPPRARNPGVYPRLKLWQRAGVEGGFAVMVGKSLGHDSKYAPLRWAELARENLREGITRGLPEGSPGRAVIQAMVLGEKPPGDSEVSRAFRESGAMHVFAVSGLHVTLVGGLVWLLFTIVPIPRRAAVFVVIAGMVSYAFITGVRPPAVRATLMAVCFLSAFVLRRRPSLFNALAFSLILVVCWQPSQVLDVGFQLSYGVLVAIGAGVGVAYRLTGKMAELDPFFPARLLSDGQRRRMGWRRYYANLSASSIAAWVGSLPLMIWHFGIATPVAVFTSLILIPLTTLILGGGFLATFVGFISPTLGGWVNQANSLIATTAFYSARSFAKVPYGHWQTRRLTEADWVVFDPADGGAASFLDLENGTMIDVGGREFYHEELRSILGRWSVSLDTVIVSHPDADHIGALPSLQKKHSFRRAILPVRNARSPAYREFLSNPSGCEMLYPASGEIIELAPDVSLEILRQGQPSDRGIADNRGLVMRVIWKGWKILLTGDLGPDGESSLLESGLDLSADIILMGRHPWGGSGQSQFLRATGARGIITSSASFPPYEIPGEHWIRAVKKAGFELFNQAETGAVLIDITEDSLTLRSYLDPDRKLTLQR